VASLGVKYLFLQERHDNPAKERGQAYSCPYFAVLEMIAVLFSLANTRAKT
jgi:hypothetical protein